MWQIKDTLKLMNHNFPHHRLTLLMLCLVVIITACSQSQQSTPTSLPTITPISGWQKLSNDGFEIWLPENFVGGTKLNLDEMAQQLAELGPDFEQQASALKAGKISFTIFAFDRNKGERGLITNLVVSKEALSGNGSIEKYVEELGNNLTEPYKVAETKTLTSDRYPIGVLIINANIPQVGEISQIMYAVKNGSAVWQILFTTPSDEFQERLPVFEDIVATATVPFMPEDRSRQGNPTSFVIGVVLLITGLFLNYWQRWKKRSKEKSVP